MVKSSCANSRVTILACEGRHGRVLRGYSNQRHSSPNACRKRCACCVEVHEQVVHKSMHAGALLLLTLERYRVCFLYICPFAWIAICLYIGAIYVILTSVQGLPALEFRYTGWRIDGPDETYGPYLLPPVLQNEHSWVATTRGSASRLHCRRRGCVGRRRSGRGSTGKRRR